MRPMTWLDDVRQDVTYACRTLRRSPGFASVAILTLALGIGANTAIFGVVNAVLLRALPYRDPASLMVVDTGDFGLNLGTVLPGWRDRARTMDRFGGFSGPRPATLVSGGSPEAVQVTGVTWDFLSFLGVAPALGRDFVEADVVAGAPAVVLLSHDLWTRTFGGSPDVIGRTVTLSGTPATIVGVTTPSFRFPTAGDRPMFGSLIDTQPDILRAAPAERSLTVIGRLARGTALPAAAEELLAIYRQEAEREVTREALERVRINIGPLQDRLVGDLKARLWLVMGAVSIVLLVACANVANLLLARATVRQRELAVRAALGAGRVRLARLLLTESLVLALLGSLAALVIAYWSRGIAQTLLANRMPHVSRIAIDWQVMAFAVGLATITGTLCGLASLPGISRVNLAGMFGGSASAAGRGLVRRALLSAEAAVTFVLVVGAALLAQTLWNLITQDNGFDANRLLTVRVSPVLPSDLERSDRGRYASEFFNSVLGRLERVPGVVSAGAVSLGPLEGIGAGFMGITVNGHQAPNQTLTPVAYVTPGYFRTLQIPIIRGREFLESDRAGTGLVAVVNETFAERFSADAEILGALVTSQGGPERFTVVGLARDVPDRSLRRAPDPLLMAPLAQMPDVHITWLSASLVLRTAGDPRRLTPMVRREIWAIDPNLVIGAVETMEERVAAGMRPERDTAILFGLFGIATLLMAGIGVYGVAAYGIAERTKEIGIRIALGAARPDVWRLVVAQALWPTLLGIAAGMACAAMLVRFVASIVYGVAPLDPATFAAAGLVLVGMALAATWFPARHAMRIDPVVALKQE